MGHAECRDCDWRGRRSDTEEGDSDEWAPLGMGKKIYFV